MTEKYIPFRDRIGLAIVKAFQDNYEKYGAEDCDYSPDTCYRAADEVIALLMSSLTGQRFEAQFHSHTIWPAKFISDGIRYD